jgi:hypothetical protein
MIISEISGKNLIPPINHHKKIVLFSGDESRISFELRNPYGWIELELWAIRQNKGILLFVVASVEEDYENQRYEVDESLLLEG